MPRWGCCGHLAEGVQVADHATAFVFHAPCAAQRTSSTTRWGGGDGGDGVATEPTCHAVRALAQPVVEPPTAVLALVLHPAPVQRLCRPGPCYTPMRWVQGGRRQWREITSWLSQQDAVYRLLDVDCVLAGALVQLACWQVLCLECSRVLGNCCVDAESVGRCAGAAGKLRCFASDVAGRRATAVWTQHSVGGLSALPTSTCRTVAARTPSLAPTHRRSQLALPRAHAPAPGLGGCVAAAHASQLGPHVELAGTHWESDRPGKQSGELLLQRCGRLGE